MKHGLHIGDSMQLAQDLDDGQIDCIVTSPPYWGLRDYGTDGQLGLEATPEEYTEKLVALFHELRRGLNDKGTLWLNLGDSYASDTKGTGGPSDKQLSNAGSRYNSRRLNHGLKQKDLVGIPWRVAFALQADGWYLRSDIIWSKPNPMPESVTDRPTKAHEYIFLLSKSQKYFYDCDAVREKIKPSTEDRNKYKWTGKLGRNVPKEKRPDRQVETHSELCNPKGANRRTVWTVATQPYSGAHFATFPPDLIKPCIMAGCPELGTVLDPFMGSGTTGMVAQDLGRKWIGFELNEDYAELIKKRTAQQGLFGGKS